MDDVIKFIQSFLALEYEANIQSRCERDTTLVETTLHNLNQLFRGLDPAISLSSSRMLQDPQTVKSQFQPRVLFRIEQYDHLTLGALYRVYLSSSLRGDEKYFTNLFVANTENGLRIIARYNLCDYCDGSGQRARRVCDECHGMGWNWGGGQKLDLLGELVETRQFTQPTRRV
jgi:hypothetical protein